ncbi:MAG: AarF/ABC1/UbiB kinase family protein [Nanoarchaeota archaeon]
MHIEKEVRDIERLHEIFRILMKYGFGPFIRDLGMRKFFHKKKSPLKSDMLSPGKAVNLLEDLGASFIKLGQLLSIRPDLIPHDYCEAFRSLQDQVPPISFAKVKDVIETELHKPLGKLFKRFDEKPIASASVGQVHRAVLPGGDIVAVKVQRPSVQNAFAADIDIMYAVARFIQRYYKPELIDPVGIVREFEQYTQHELNYVHEGKNIERFHHNFRKDASIVIPKVHWEWTTKRVLTMEFILGKKASQVKKPKNAKLVIEHTVSSVFKMIFEDGFFHADPHPGNILLLNQGRIAFVDFGIAGMLDESVREGITTLFISLIDANLDEAVQSMYQLGFISSAQDHMKLKRELYEYFADYYDTELQQIKMSDVFHRLMKFGMKNKVEMPADFVLLGKAIVTVEGFAHSLNPDFNLVRFAKPYVGRLVARRLRPQHVLHSIIKQSRSLKEAALKLPRQMDELMLRTKEADTYINAIDHDIKGLSTEINRTGNRLGMALLIASFVIGGSLMLIVEQPSWSNIPIYSGLSYSFAMIFTFIFFGSVILERR